MNVNEALQPQFDRLERRFVALGAIALALSLLGAFVNPTEFFRSYLLAYAFWIGFPLGCLALLMLHHLAGGYWGFVIRRSLEAGSRTFWLMAVLFVPLLVGLFRLYAWAQPAAAQDPLWRQKDFYLNVPFFVGRAVAYFVQSKPAELKRHRGRILTPIGSATVGGAYRVLVDENQHVDREGAVRAGIGFYGKNTMLITRRFGS